MDEINLKYRNNVDMSKNIRFGIEIEFSDVNHNLIKYCLKDAQTKGKYLNYVLDTDSTINRLSNYGYLLGGEIKTPILTNNLKNWKELKNICIMLKEYGANINRNCGCHIHYDRDIIINDNKKFINFLKLWTVFENIIFRFCCGENSELRNNICTFCKEIGRDVYGLLTSSSNYSDDEICDIIIKNYNDKKHAIDFSKKYETLEIRIPGGTINYSIIQNYVLLFYKMFMYSTNNNFDSDLINYKLKNYDKSKMVLETYKDIDIESARLFSDLIYNTKEDKRLFLKQYLKKF